MHPLGGDDRMRIFRDFTVSEMWDIWIHEHYGFPTIGWIEFCEREKGTELTELQRDYLSRFGFKRMERIE